MRRSLLIALLLALGASSRLAAFDPAPCEPPADPTRKDFRIDASTGGTKGLNRYELEDQVRILLVNKNPFLYEYKITIQEEQVPEKGLTDFLRIFAFVPSILPPPPTQPAAPTAPASASTPALRALADRCDEALDNLSGLRRVIEEHDPRINTGNIELQAAYETAAKAYEAFLKTLEEPRKDMTTAGNDCPKVAKGAKTFVELVVEFEKKPLLVSVNDKLTALKVLVDTQSALVTSYERGVPEECKPRISEDVTDWRNQIIVAKHTVEQVTGKVKEITDGRAEIVKQSNKVVEIASNPNAFFEIRERGPYDDLTNVKIKVQQKPLRVENASFSDLGNWELNFGGRPRFSISAGIAYSHMEDQTFKRVTGIPRPDRNSAPPASGTLKSVVGLDRDSEWRATPLVLLNARLWEPKAVLEAVHLSFGVSAKIENSSTNAEFLAGLSMSFARERLFLTVGGYYGGVNELGGDLFVGAEVPDTLNDIPTRKERHWKPGFSISYKLN